MGGNMKLKIADLALDGTDTVLYINTLIEDAIVHGASDIHLEPQREKTRVRFRIDGDLSTVAMLDKEGHQGLITRIKILSNLSITERRLPQDGSFTFEQDEGVDLRVALLPTIYGEKAVIRILSRERYKLGLEDFDFPEETLTRLRSIAARTRGMLISSGPTGCGKTTTLYALLHELNREHRNILTIEDPVEYKIEGIHQMQVNDKAGMTFARGLRAMLRADPDIILVGEIRDQETAQTAVRAAITGHGVVSTIHTYDSYSAIIRLLDMGVEPYLIASALSGVQSQRLIKKLCPHCKKKGQPTRQEMAMLHHLLGEEISIQLYEPAGCEHCNGGFLGRQVISEVFEIDDGFIRLIKSRVDISELRIHGKNSGVRTMLEDGLGRAVRGELYLPDVIRATQSIGGEEVDG